jgi:hypothetical protein
MIKYQYESLFLLAIPESPVETLAAECLPVLSPRIREHE